MSISIIILVVVGLLLVWAVFSYNSFIRLINNAREAWADIDVQLKRRYDLIPNLVNTVKGYATHETGAFEKVTEARSRAMQAGTTAEKADAENMLAGTLKSLFAIAEAYPDLKANTNFLELQRELSDTENKIQASRRFYNSNVKELNITIDSFPSNLIGSLFKFQKMNLFELSEQDAPAKNPVEVKF